MKIVTKIVLLVFSTVALVMTAVSILISNETQNIVYEQIDRILLTNLAFAAKEINRTDISIRRTAEIIAQNRNIRKSLDLNVSRGINQILNGLVATYPFLNYIAITEPNGNIFATNTRNSAGKKIGGEQLLGISIKNNPLYVESRPGATSSGAPGRDPFLTLIGMDRGMSQWFVAPIEKRGKLIGWLVLSYDWEYEQSALLLGITRSLVANGNPTTETILTDSKRNVVVGRQAGKRKFEPGSDQIWQSRRVNFGPTAMNLTIVNDRAKTEAPIVSARNVLVSVFLLGAVLLMVILYVALRRTLITRLAVLHIGTIELSKGNLGYRLPAQGQDEIGDLSQAFNQMGESLERTTVSRDNLADEVEQRKIIEDHLETRSAKLAIVNKELEMFVYVASHDLKAPLRGIDNLASWIEEDLESTLEGEPRENLTLLRGRVRRLEGLLDGLLQYSRIGHVSSEIERVDIGALVAETVDLLALPKGFSVDVPADMPIMETQKVPLEHVFRNLIGNAVKHHDRNEGRIVIGARENAGCVEFTVSDDGPGIAPEFQDRIFGMFQTLKPRDEVEGSGMGLALVKKEVEIHGGTVWIDSVIGTRGTKLHFTWINSSNVKERS